MGQKTKMFPVEIWCHVFLFLEIKKRSEMRLVCKEFHDMLEVRVLWMDVRLDVFIPNARDHGHLFRVCPWNKQSKAFMKRVFLECKDSETMQTCVCMAIDRIDGLKLIKKTGGVVIFFCLSNTGRQHGVDGG